jgi:hypothetical protein
METSTLKTIVTVLFGVCAVWILIIFIRREFHNLGRVILVILLLGGAYYFLQKTTLERVTVAAIRHQLFPAKAQDWEYTVDQRTGGSPIPSTFSPTSVRVWAEALPGEEPRYRGHRPVNVASLSGPSSGRNGHPELSSITDNVATLLPLVDYPYAPLVIEGTCHKSEVETYHCIATLRLKQVEPDVSASTAAALVLAAMVAAYIAAKLLKVSPELSLFAAALAGGLAGGAGLPVRHIAEGAFTYFDIILIFVAATFFMNILKESGGVAYAVRGILRRFHRHKVPLFILLALLLLVPGALTGAGSVTVLIVGGMAATVLATMDIPRPKIAAIIFTIAGLSAAAPPVSLWAMLTAAGVNMPYVGFFLPLLVPCLVLSLLTIFILGARSKPVDLEKAWRELPVPPPGMRGWKLALPFIVFFLLVLAGRLFPFSFPILGLPLIFAAAAALSVLLSPVRLPVVRIAADTVHQLLPLIGTPTCAGILVRC